MKRYSVPKTECLQVVCSSLLTGSVVNTQLGSITVERAQAQVVYL